MLCRIVLFAAAIAAVACNASAAHPGALNAEGCPANLTTDADHCHRRGGTAAARASGTAAKRSQTIFRNCAEARAAGAAPVRAGHPGYSRRLDRDHDAIGCE